MVLSACSSSDVADSSYKGVPSGVALPEGDGSENVAVIAPGDGSVEVVTWGSSSCPLTATEFSNTGTRMTVTFEQLTKADACTADLAPRTHVFSAEKVGAQIPDTATITNLEGKEPSVFEIKVEKR